MPKLAANLSMMFNEVGFMDRFGIAAKAGFKGVEYLFPYEFPADEIGEQLDRHDLQQVLFDFPAGDFAAESPFNQTARASSRMVWDRRWSTQSLSIASD